MRSLTSFAGALLLSLGLAGLALLALGPRQQLQLELTRLAVRAGMIAAPDAPDAAPISAEEVRELTQLSSPEVAGLRLPEAGTPDGDPPRRLHIPTIRLDAEVVPARLVRLGTEDGAITWEVPAHRVGHAQGTAGAGAEGNTVLLGHVSSVNAGNVFAKLDRLQPGDEIVVDAARAYTYRVEEVRRVTREDLSVLAPSVGATLTLITCTGTWLPDALDYSHRLTVRATRVS